MVSVGLHVDRLSPGSTYYRGQSAARCVLCNCSHGLRHLEKPNVYVQSSRRGMAGFPSGCETWWNASQGRTDCTLAQYQMDPSITTYEIVTRLPEPAGFTLSVWRVAEAHGMGPVVKQPARFYGFELVWMMVFMPCIFNVATFVTCVPPPCLMTLILFGLGSYRNVPDFASDATARRPDYFPATSDAPRDGSGRSPPADDNGDVKTDVYISISHKRILMVCNNAI